jgi:hypothetical protein
MENLHNWHKLLSKWLKRHSGPTYRVYNFFLHNTHHVLKGDDFCTYSLLIRRHSGDRKCHRRPAFLLIVARELHQWCVIEVSRRLACKLWNTCSALVFPRNGTVLSSCSIIEDQIQTSTISGKQHVQQLTHSANGQTIHRFQDLAAVVIHCHRI